MAADDDHGGAVTPATATSARSTAEPFPADVDPASIVPEDLPGDGYGDLTEIDDFEDLVRRFRAGAIEDDDFKPMRLHMGCYGIRQATTHMVRIKAPLGRFDARQFEAMAVIAERWSRGFAHITTRQNFQFHFVKLEDVPDVMRVAALAGLTTREACGNSIRNVTMSPLAGVHPDEVHNVEAAADEIVRHFLRHGQFQDLPRKFKIAFSAANDDDAGTGFHDLGVLPAVDADGNPGYRVVLGGGLGSSPHEAVLLEDLTPAELLLPTVHAALELFNEEGERRNRVRARMKFLVKKLGREAFVAKVLERRDVAIANGLRSTVVPHLPAASGPTADAPLDLPSDLADRDTPAYRYWLSTNTLRQRQGDRFAVYAAIHLGDLDTAQFRGLGELMRANDIVDARLTIRQNVVFRDVRPERLAYLWAGLVDLGLDRPLAEKSGDIVSCPGAETCNLAITASRGLAEAITSDLVERSLHEIEGVRMNISGCPNSCGQHQAWDIGFSGMARRDSLGNEGPGYRVFVGGRIDDGGARFGDYVAKVPARRAPEAAARILARFREERIDDEPLWSWYDRTGKAEVAALVADLETVPEKADAPDFYVDWGASETFEVILGQGECMV
jgi:sulfite reductase beta subunit-like hemoprotein